MIGKTWSLITSTIFVKIGKTVAEKAALKANPDCFKELIEFSKSPVISAVSSLTTPAA